MSIGTNAARGARPGEFEIISRYFAPLAADEGAFGLLDDAAKLSVDPDFEAVVTKDSLAATIHFLADDPPADIARKALRVNLSDLAAKGCEPRYYLLSLALADDWTEEWLAAFAGGLADDQARFGVQLLGGDTLKSPGGTVISVTAIGVLPKGSMVTRLGAKNGDCLYVTGSIGDGALGLLVHKGAPRSIRWSLEPSESDHLRNRYLLPEPRTALAPVLRRHAHAAMDVSDGLIGDLRKLCHASGLGAVLDIDTVPYSPAAAAVLAADRSIRDLALDGGDDYEILCAIPEHAAADFESEARAVGIPATRIGELTKYASDVSVIDAGGETISLSTRSFSHF